MAHRHSNLHRIEYHHPHSHRHVVCSETSETIDDIIGNDHSLLLNVDPPPPPSTPPSTANADNTATAITITAEPISTETPKLRGNRVSEHIFGRDLVFEHKCKSLRKCHSVQRLIECMHIWNGNGDEERINELLSQNG